MEHILLDIFSKEKESVKDLFGMYFMLSLISKIRLREDKLNQVIQYEVSAIRQVSWQEKQEYLHLVNTF